jgi:hypothetical protein
MTRKSNRSDYYAADNIDDIVRILNKELAADSMESMVTWIKDIENV